MLEQKNSTANGYKTNFEQFWKKTFQKTWYTSTWQSKVNKKRNCLIKESPTIFANTCVGNWCYTKFGRILVS